MPRDTETALISVVTPCFNAAATLEESVASVMGQSYPHIEMILVDDGSTDHTAAIGARLHHQDQRVRLVSQENRGAARARNHGLALASGRYIAFLDADDYWSPDCLAALHDALVRSPDAALAYCGWQNVGCPGGRGDPFVPPNYESGKKLEILLAACRWPIHAALTKREAIEAAGRFDERLTSCMDYDLWLKIATADRIVRVPKVLAYYRHHDGEQITKNRTKIALNHLRVQHNYLDAHPDVEERLGTAKVRNLVYGELLNRGYESYWARDLVAARAIFREVMRHRFGEIKDWKYMLPSWLPLGLHQRLVAWADD
ncbi:MAG: glycosyltransferase [Pseudomonadota bacterium]